MDTMRISELAGRSGVPATTLRYHEGAGLLLADRTSAGYRVYGEDAVERLAFIGAAKRLGLPLQEIAELLQVWGDGDCAQVKAELRPRVAARLAQAEARAAELDAFVAGLRWALGRLDGLADRTVAATPGAASPPQPRPGRRPPVMSARRSRSHRAVTRRWRAR